MKFLILIICLNSLGVVAADLRSFGNYSVSLKRSKDGDSGDLIIEKNGKVVFKETEIGQHYFWGDLSGAEIDGEVITFVWWI